MSDSKTQSQVLIATVGLDTDKPLELSIKHYNPNGVILIDSLESANTSQKIKESLKGCWVEILTINDVNNWDEAYRVAQQGLEIALNSSPNRTKLIVELTFGTKIMSAGLVLALVGYGARWSYVTVKRDTKGRFLDTTMRVNTFETDPTHSIESLRSFYQSWNNWQFEDADMNLDRVLEHKLSETEKEFYSKLKRVVKGLSSWDCFRYDEALEVLKGVLPTALKLSDDLADDQAYNVLRSLGNEFIPQLEALVTGQGKSNLNLLQDILANAQRRADVQRYDDAIIRYVQAVYAGLKLDGEHSELLTKLTNDVEEGNLRNLLKKCEQSILLGGFSPMDFNDYVQIESYLIKHYEELGFIPARNWPKWQSVRVA